MPQNKKALCVGINNYPGAGNDLRGCVNDANAWANLLKTNFGFPAANVKILLDAQATKTNILNELKNLIADAKAGDVLVYTNSSHGTYVAANADDEFYDEAVCAVDVNILDDEFRHLFALVPKGVRLTVILDNCHSGTGTRLVPNADRKKRFLNPSERGLPELADFANAQPKSSGLSQSKMKEVLLSGCRADEVSWDVKIGSTFHGAMTFCAIQAIKEANFQISYAELQTRLQEILDDEEYDQHPQLEGKSANKKRQIFS
jgi:hypothetical protein